MPADLSFLIFSFAISATSADPALVANRRRKSRATFLWEFQADRLAADLEISLVGLAFFLGVADRRCLIAEDAAAEAMRFDDNPARQLIAPNNKMRTIGSRLALLFDVHRPSLNGRTE